MSSEQIKSLGKDYWIEMINEVKEISYKINNSGFNGGQSWKISGIYNALHLYDEVSNMAKQGFQIWESEIKVVIENTCFRTTLKDKLNEYIEYMMCNKSFWSVVHIIDSLFSVATFITGILFLIRVLIPKKDPKLYKEKGVVIDSFIFFQSIAKNKTLNDYKSKLVNCQKKICVMM